MLIHPNIVPVSRATRTPVEAVKPVVRLAGVRLAGVRLSGCVVAVNPLVVVICVTGLMKLTAVVLAGVCDVVASTCVAFVGHTVPLTVMVSRIGNGLQLFVSEQKLDHSRFIHAQFLELWQLHIPVYNKGTHLTLKS